MYVVDIMEKRLEKALELGATGVINGSKEDVLERVKPNSLIRIRK